MGDHAAADIDKHVRTYIIVFVSLMFLTVVTVLVARLHLPAPAAIALALAIASVKGGLVACYFMHLISEKKLIYCVLGITVSCFIPVLVIPLLTQLDQAGH